MNSFSVRTKIMEGGGLETLAPKLHKVFIVTDGFMASSGKVSYITEKLDRAGAEYRVFDQVKADPDIGTVTKGVDMIQEFHPDAVIAFGGGSPIDAAKAIVFFAAKTCDMRECMFIAVPTTSGTGSEVSKFAVITDPEKEVKYPLVEDSLLPDVAILDAELTVSVPPSVTADTGIDVFTHAVEALVSTAATDFSDAAAEKAIKLVRRHLMTAYHQPGDAQCLLSGRRGLLQFRIGPQPRHGPRAGRAFPHPPRQSQRDPVALCNEFQRRLFGEPDACGQAVCQDCPPAGPGGYQRPPERAESDPNGQEICGAAQHSLQHPGGWSGQGRVRGRGGGYGGGRPGGPLHGHKSPAL